MNVLFLSELFHPHGSGAELATYIYAKLLSEADFNVVVVTNRFAGESEFSKSGNLMVYRLPLFKKSESVKYSILRRFDILLSGFMKKLMKWADAVYIPRFWYSAIPLAKAYGKPVVVHLHDYIPICPLANFYDSSKDTICNRNSRLCSSKCIYVYEKNQGRDFNETLTSVVLNLTLGRYLGRLVRLSDAIICVSKTQRDIITKATPSLGSKIHAIHNPLPNLSYMDIEGDDFGYFGGPSYLKGFNSLCRALVHINHCGPVRIHATNFPNLTEEGFEPLHNIGILSYGRLGYDLFEKVYRQIRAVIVPSVWPEPLPYVVSEAILRGRLVIASNIGGIPEQIGDTLDTFLFYPADIERLAELIEHVNDLDRQTIIDLASKNREIFLKKFDNERILLDFINMLNRTVSS